MKNILFFLMLPVACTDGSDIRGVYTRHVESEYSVGEDTLFISPSDGHYNMERHTGYCAIKNGLPGNRQIKRQYSALVDAGDNQWQDSKTGTLITLDSNGLLLGTAAYQKIK